MQQLRLHKKLYHIQKIDETEYSAEVYKRERIIDKYAKLKLEGCSEKIIFETLDISRATYYRWKKSYKICGLAGLENQSKRPNKIRTPEWSRELEQHVLKLRRKFPLWGKYKISALLKREYNIKVSVSTVGRIISSLIQREKIRPVSFFFGKVKNKQPRQFAGHSKRLPRGIKAKIPGELVQIDHMEVKLEKSSFKSFTAICPITKFIVEQAYTNATSTTAADFLEYAKSQFPFPIKSIQVDGGSEFMKDFEKSCKNSNIPLYVLPPRSPKINGSVERGNSTVKYEFYYQYDGCPKLSIIRHKLRSFIAFYNGFRPHQALHYLTPKQYYQSMGAK